MDFIVEEKHMTFIEAVNAMSVGKKVRRPTFHKDNYLYFKDHILMSGLTNERAYLCESHFNATDWEIVEKLKTLSDKIIKAIINDKEDGPVFRESIVVEDVSKAIEEFINWCYKPHNIHNSGDGARQKARDIFGMRLVK